MTQTPAPSFPIPPRPARQRWILLPLLLGGLSLLAAAARADTVSIRSSSDSDSVAPLVYTDVKITDIRDHRLTFTTASGNSVVKNLSEVVAMTLDDEPQFNQAQQDYAANRLTAAIDEFNQTIQNTDKAWLKGYCEPLLTDAANKAGRFDLAARGYAWLVVNDPASAASLRPTVPGADSSFLDPAAKTLADAANTAGLSAAQETQLLSLLLDVDRQRKDSAGMEDVAGRLQQLAGDSSSTASIASLALADARLADAGTALGQKDYTRAAKLITSNGNLFVDIHRQAEALYLLAQAREGQAAAKDDSAGWQDAAIAYMRVAADFKDAPQAPHVAASLLQAARIIQTHLNQPANALRIYQSIVAQYPNTVPAEQASNEIRSLQSVHSGG